MNVIVAANGEQRDFTLPDHESLFFVAHVKRRGAATVLRFARDTLRLPPRVARGAEWLAAQSFAAAFDGCRPRSW